MLRRLINSYSSQFLSRWIVLFIDTLITGTAFLASYLIRYNFDYSQINPYNVQLQEGMVLTAYLFGFFVLQSFSGIIRHTGMVDALKIFKATSVAFILLMITNASVNIYLPESRISVPYSILITHYLMTMFFLVGSRMFIRLMYIQLMRKYTKKRINVVIYGAGAAGLLTKNVLLQDPVFHYEIISFIDDNPSKIRKTLEGIPVVSSYRALRGSYVKQHEVELLIIAIQDMRPERRSKIVEAGLDLHLHVKVVPAIDLWINGQLSSQQLRRVKIEELLERDPIKLDSKNIVRELKNKVVMVTGAAGSIGSEIARQVLSFSPSRIILLDQAESPLYDLQFELKNNKNFKTQFEHIEFIVANVKDRLRMQRIMDVYRPQVIYHCAAYKHVPLMEDNPYEALLVNVFGTKIVADLAIKYGAEKFVMVSTDKAVNPTNIMGASKRIAEIYIQSLSNEQTHFVTTRFGNVLGSNGSVVPLFRKQIESNGPVTVTHKDITRYFMTIPEACNLVLEAGAMGTGSDIFVFDMGSPVKIYDMARKMIQLYGFEPGRDIEIVETGLRPGEKLFEELLTDKENTLPTHHPKIMRARVSPQARFTANGYIDQLSELIIDADEFALVGMMKQIVPEYISNNSVYEKLDIKK
ncbi:MAG: hypothetical protein A2W85_03495 [Bacteroidetes bacterium GWF2_41_31]|nr:MAG: hypothetical protein A2W85_03495 [Bacteroidetes bacterium GWF2_41_31]